LWDASALVKRYAPEAGSETADAALLYAYLSHARIQSAAGMTCILVAADQRLVRAAEAEGLATLNPERVAAADMPGLISVP
jgi:predicted nucleic acid-binding protein